MAAKILCHRDVVRDYVVMYNYNKRKNALNSANDSRVLSAIHRRRGCAAHPLLPLVACCIIFGKLFRSLTEARAACVRR
jgi:hypothetical protein